MSPARGVQAPSVRPPAPAESKLEKNEEAALLSWEIYLKESYLQNQQYQQKQRPEQKIQDIGNKYRRPGQPRGARNPHGPKSHRGHGSPGGEARALLLGREACVLQLTRGSPLGKDRSHGVGRRVKAAPALGAGLILDLLRRQGWGELVLLALCLSLGQERRGHVPCGYGSSWPWCSPVGHAGRGVSCRLVGVGGQPVGGLPAGRRAPSPQSCAPALLGVSQLIRGLEPMMAAIAWRGFQSVPEGGHMESGCASRLETQGVVLPCTSHLPALPGRVRAPRPREAAWPVRPHRPGAELS